MTKVFNYISSNFKRIIKSQLRNIRRLVAGFFLLIIIICFVYAIKIDAEIIRHESFLAFGKGLRPINYILQFNTFDIDSKSVKGTLTVKPTALRKWNGDDTIFFGPLEYTDLTFSCALFPESLSKLEDLFAKTSILKAKRDAHFTKSLPKVQGVSISTFGNPELYPFDKYLIAGIVKCAAYSIEDNKKDFINTRKDGEHLVIENFMKGFLIRDPSYKELNEIKKAFLGETAKITEVSALTDLNNREDRFAFIMERPYSLQLLTIFLGIIALLSAFYIGFKTPLKEIPIHAMSYIVILWGIHDLLLGGTKIFPSYFDYAVLFMYSILFAGIIYRIIRGPKSVS